MSLLESSQLLPSRRFKTLRTIMALILREILVLTGLSRHLPAAAVFYPAVALLAGIGMNYLWIGSYG